MDPKLIGVIIGITITAIFAGLIRLVPVIAKAVKPNPGSGPKLDTVKSIECKPGKAQICIDRGTTLTRHNETIKHLIEGLNESKEGQKEIRNKLDSGFQRVYDKLDRIK